MPCTSDSFASRSKRARKSSKKPQRLTQQQGPRCRSGMFICIHVMGAGHFPGSFGVRTCMHAWRRERGMRTTPTSWLCIFSSVSQMERETRGVRRASLLRGGAAAFQLGAAVEEASSSGACWSGAVDAFPVPRRAMPSAGNIVTRAPGACRILSRSSLRRAPCGFWIV